MIGILLSFITAILTSAKDFFTKKTTKEAKEAQEKLEKKITKAEKASTITDKEYILAWALPTFFLPFLYLLLFLDGILLNGALLGGFPKLGKNFLPALIGEGPLMVVAVIFYVKALSKDDLSLVTPILCLTPIVILIIAPFTIKQTPTLIGLLGVLLTVIGTYTLKIKERSKGLLEPFKALIQNKGVRCMFYTAMLWGITSIIDKVGVNNSSPLVWVISINTFTSISIFLLIILRHKHNPKKIKKVFTDWKTLAQISACDSISKITQMSAINFIQVVYVNSIKRFSIVISVLIGALYFKEKGSKERISGAIISIIGVILIGIGSL
ncbi:MAG: EamA family transporter [bacterium]